MGGPCDYSVSPWSKSFFFLFGGLLFNLGVNLGPRLGLGPGRDNLQYSVNRGEIFFRLDTVHRLVRSFLIYWRVLCFMKDENLLSMFGIGRDMVDKQVKLKIMLLVIV